MSVEVKKYLPENTAPEQFMRPPTEPFREQVIPLCQELETRINDRASEIVINRGRVGRTIRKILGISDLPISPGLQLGTELEIFLFSSRSTPHQDAEKKRGNPNYARKHLNAVEDMSKAVAGSPYAEGLGDVISSDVTLWRISMEIRTKPGGVDNYLMAMDRIREWFQRNGASGGVHPVIYSQHIHFSLVDRARIRNLFTSSSWGRNVEVGLIDTYSRSNPLVLLPEEVERDYGRDIGLYNGVKKKGGRSLVDPERIEARMNNSEYAFDPYLNLLVNLLGVYRALAAENRVQLVEFHKGVSVNADYGEPRYYFQIGKKHRSYEREVEGLTNDSVLQQLLPANLLSRLPFVYQDYWNISSGETSVQAAREAAQGLIIDQAA